MAKPQDMDHGVKQQSDVITASDTGTSDPPAKASTLQQFISARGLKPPDKSRSELSDASKTPKLTAELLSKVYTKRRHGERTRQQRDALREPDDVFSESVDAYVPKKRQLELLNVHRDEQEVNEAYLTASRALFFARDMLDKEVCDREENRNVFEDKLWEMIANIRGLQIVQDEEQDNNQETEDVSLEAVAQM